MGYRKVLCRHIACGTILGAPQPLTTILISSSMKAPIGDPKTLCKGPVGPPLNGALWGYRKVLCQGQLVGNDDRGGHRLTATLS